MEEPPGLPSDNRACAQLHRRIRGAHEIGDASARQILRKDDAPAWSLHAPSPTRWSLWTPRDLQAQAGQEIFTNSKGDRTSLLPSQILAN